MTVATFRHGSLVRRCVDGGAGVERSNNKKHVAESKRNLVDVESCLRPALKPRR